MQLGEFVIFIDHKSLIHLSDQRLHTAWQQKVFTKLLGMQYRIVYKPSTDNRVADALSHLGHPEELSAVSAPVPSWLDAIIHSYNSDARAQELLTKLAVSENSEPHFSMHQGLLRYKGHIWVGPDDILQQKIITTFHSSPVGGHSGFPATYRRIRQLFA